MTESPQCRKVNFADVRWADITATTSLASIVLKGLGYTPSKTLVLVPKVFEHLKHKTFDIFLGYWNPTMTPIIEPYLQEGSVKLLDIPNLTGAKFTLAVPTYAVGVGLKDFADIHKFRDQLDNKIYGLEPGNDGNALLRKMINHNDFGLKGFELVESSENFLLPTVDRAIQQKKLIVFLGWAPHPMNELFKITYLSGGDKIFGANYGGASIYTVVSADFLDRCPNVGSFMKNLRFTVPMENQVMALIVDGYDPMAAAKEWLKQHHDVLSRWLKGVNTVDGKNGLVAVKSFLGITG
ncbi:MAG: choline ABC transporter substrate-binding protein [Gammaproteobacteria bacterium]|nr:choline ABC transporter substrate-binding protein [Gammaproteobacteria bacterium]